MELNFTIETDDLYGEDGTDFEYLLTDSLQKAVIKSAKSDMKSDKFNEFAQLASDTIVAEIKLKLANFLSEEIALTEGWGKPTFVGSIEDLIKQRFDDILLRPVDSDGKTLQGCTSSGKTWIEWRIERDLEKSLKDKMGTAERNIIKWVEKYIHEKIIEIKNTAIKDQIDDAFVSMLKKA